MEKNLVLARDLTTFVNAYIETALWASSDDAGENFEGRECDLTPESRTKITEDCREFLEGVAWEDFGATKHDALAYGAHNFFLTRNHHGAGFWDGDYGDAPGKRLTEYAHSFGTSCLYEGDDEKLHEGSA